jgi:glycosyltransferase involved in cell wall biosynthesis
MHLSIVIPAHNEEHRLTPTLVDYVEFCRERYRDEFELIIVANHCSDATVQVARKIAETCPQIKIVVEPSRVGKGGAVEIGLKQAIGERVGFVDADGATPPREFGKLIDNLGDAGAIIASRWIAGADVNPPQPPLRRAASRVLNHLIVRHLFGLRIHDTQCGAKLFRRDALDQILREPLEPGWAFDIDMLCRLKNNHYTVIEFPGEWHHIPGSAVTFLAMSLQMLGSVLRLKRAQLSRRKKESQ